MLVVLVVSQKCTLIHELTQGMKSCLPTTMQISNFPRQTLIQWVIFIETSFDGSKLVFDWLVALLR